MDGVTCGSYVEFKLVVDKLSKLSWGGRFLFVC